MANNAILLAIPLIFLIVVPVSEAGFITNQINKIFPRVEITLSNDGSHSVFYMCQMTNKSDSLHELKPHETYRFDFPLIAFPMRWCYLYINNVSNGFFWAYTVRARCTKCFWSIEKHPNLFRADKSRWERQKLFMPPDFNITSYLANSTSKSSVS